MPDVSFVIKSAGMYHTAAITSSGRSVCWGDDDDRRVAGVPGSKPDESLVMAPAGIYHRQPLFRVVVLSLGGADGNRRVSGFPELMPDESFAHDFCRSVSSHSSHRFEWS